MDPEKAVKNIISDAENEYKDEICKILNDNQKYLNLFRKNIPSSSIQPQSYRTNVIPFIQPHPRYTFYMDAPKNIPSQDDPILRYIPYINTTSHENSVNIINYDETSLKENPLNYKEELRERALIKTFSHYSDLDLFNLKNLYDQKDPTVDVHLKNRFPLILAVIKTMDLSLECILNHWEKYFDTRPKTLYNDNNAFREHFCHVCMIFDCGLHEKIANIVVKGNTHINQKIICNCSKKSIKSECQNPKKNQITDKSCLSQKNKKIKSNSSVDHTAIARVLNNASKIIPLTSCLSSLFIKFAFQWDVECNILQNINYVALSAEKFNVPIKKRPKFCTNKIVKFAHDEFFSPCVHKGSCYKNEECKCYKLNMFCEESCLCLECDNIFEGCKCKKCNNKCQCYIYYRDCTPKCGNRYRKPETFKHTCFNTDLSFYNSKTCFIGRSFVEGFGLFAGCFIKCDSFVGEYIGEVITSEEAERRGEFYEIRKSSYLFDLCHKNGDVYHTIDASKIGNACRFINHSKNPNLRAKMFQVMGVKRIGFFAIRDIREGDELFFDYNYNQEQKKNYDLID
ncbi:putative SET domain-containing methyltransferase [Hamiltosporidium tvaerminnensis]|uniref:Putative SET domain-containing methyltransferase n=1 Tax=Hamiltosporidium tvaerminnensis TaxID=1176355 RepID=A0A4Q9LRW3_9MICR|nr:putative SET domain-containing methyltransferase [Hamiltosporidium tvaerminnensis]